MSENNVKADKPLSEIIPLNTAPTLWVHIICLALGYLMAAKLSSFSNILADNVSGLWIASGVALAGILIYGYRIWPGIFLGGLLVNGLIPTLSDGFLGNTTSVLIAIVISAGATFQAALGAYLVCRFTDFPKGFFKGNQVVVFFFYAGISALFNATLSVAMFVTTGRMLLINTFSNWLVWWSGDFLGILIFTPLLLVWLVPSSSRSFKRQIAITLPVVLLIILTALAVFISKKNSNEKIKIEFIEQALGMKMSLENTITTHLNTLYSLERFFASSVQIERAEFHSFVGHYLTEMPSIQSLGWDPIVRDSERANFERSMQLQGYSNFQITEQDAQKKIIPALHRLFYAPITFIEPQQLNERALGFDTYSEDTRRIVFNQARDSATIAMTPPIFLVQGGKGIVAVMPLYEQGASPKSLVERRNAIVGYVFVVFRPEDIVLQALKTRTIEGLSYWLSDESASTGSGLIASNNTETVYTSNTVDKSFFEKKRSIHYEARFPAGDRMWRLDIVPTKAWLSARDNDYTEWVLLFGLFLTGLVGAFIWVVTGREMEIHAFLQERVATIDLIEEQMHVQLALKERLQKKQEMMAQMFQQLPGMVCQFKSSAEGRYNFLFVSECVNEIFELSVSQVVDDKVPLFEKFHPDDYVAVLESIKVSTNTLQEWQQDFRVFLPKKGLRWLSCVAKPHKQADESVLWSGFFMDITERKKIDDAFRQEQDKFHRLFEFSPIGMALVDNETGQFLEVNHRVLEETGYSKDEFLKLSFWEITPIEYQDQEAQQLRDLQEKGCFGPNEKEYIRKDGTRYPILISGFKFTDVNGKEVVWGFIDDISKRKELAALLIERGLDKVHIAHLDRQRSLGLMSAALGHELKQPLTAILTNAQVAKRGIRKEVLTMPLIEDFLDKIVFNVQRTSNIIDKIRGFINPSVLEKTCLDVDILVRNSAVFLEQDLMLHDIIFQFSIEDSRAQVLGDGLMLSQVFVNIYRNAVEALLYQKIKIIYVSVATKNNHIVIVVQDTGLGFSCKALESITEPFYTTKAGGLGVGLSISRSIIEQNDGQLFISNAEEGGARIEIHLPQILTKN